MNKAQETIEVDGVSHKNGLFWLSPKISWKTFKILNEKISPSRGIVPKNGEKILWQMLRDRQINIFIDSKSTEDPIVITLKPIPAQATMIRDTRK